MKTVWPWRSLSTTPRAYATPLCLFAFASLVYVNTLGNAFVLDDGPRIATNPLIRDLGNIPTLFASDYSAPGAGSGLYRPLVTTSYAFNFALAGLEPMSYHAVNVVLHALVSVLVWAVYRRLVGSALAAGAGAFLFAVHAVHTEAVANVAGRAELLSAVFFLISFLGYLRRRETPGRRAFGLYATSLGAYLLALLSKESAVTLLGVIPLYDFVYGKAKAQRLLPRLWETMIGLWRPYAGYVATTVVYLGVRLFVLGAGHALPPPLQSDNPLVTLDLPWRILNTLQVALRYLGLLFFPAGLSYDYSYNQIPLLTSLVEPRVWLVLALSAAWVVMLLWSYRAWKDLFFALGFYLVTFSVVSNVLVLIGTIMAERLVYLPSVGFCLALALVLRAGCGKLPLAPRAAAQVFLGVFVLIVGLHAARTIVRNPDWKSNERLYLHDVQVAPHSIKVVINAAYALSALGQEKKAIALLEDQIRRGTKGPILYNNLGYLLIERGIDLTRGVALLEMARQQRPNDPEVLDSLGWGYYKLGRLEEARDLLQRSLELDDSTESARDRRAHLQTVEDALHRAASEGSQQPRR